MQKYILTIISTMMIVFASIPGIGQGYPWQALTPDDAIQAVKNFEHNSNLSVTITSQPNWIEGPGTTVGYLLTADHFDYYVCAYASSFLRRSDRNFTWPRDTYYGQPYNPTLLSQQAMSQKDAQVIANSFMQAHYPYPNILTGINSHAQGG